MNTAEKEELDLILASPGFWRARKLREALSFLCEKHWSANGEVPTQYDLADKLYGSTEPDIIINVRNLIMRLRTKLSEFYANNGNGNELRLEIPVGEYRVVFRHVDRGAVTSETPSPVNGASAFLPSADAESIDPSNASPPSEPTSPAVRDNPYIMNGEETPIEYVIVGDANAGSKADPSMEGLMIRRLFGSPSRFMKLLIYFAAAVILVVLIGSRFMPPRNVTAFVSEKGDRLIGWIDSENIAWDVSLGAPIRDCAELSMPEGFERRYIVAFGGRVKDIDSLPWAAPKVVIYSASGKELMEPIDLLGTFNPFDDQYRDELFELTLRALEDLDEDGFSDGVLHLTHQWYPDLLYFISGERLACTGGFANSGRCEVFKAGVSRPETRSGRGRPYGVLAHNNRMGYQEVFFTAGLSRFQVSPDILALPIIPGYGCAEHAKNYRPIGKVGGRGATMTSTPEGYFCIKNVLDEKKSVMIDRCGYRSIDPWFGGILVAPKDKEWFNALYEKVREAEQTVLDGHIDAGQDCFQSILDQAALVQMDGDLPLIHYIRTKAMASLKHAGRADLAWSWLPEDLPANIQPHTVAYIKSELMLLLRQPGAAGHFMSAYNHHDGNGRSEQFIYARILEGAAAADIHHDLQLGFQGVLRFPVCKAWLQIPGLLRGEFVDARDQIAGLTFPQPKEIDLANGVQAFPQQSEFWTALLDIELGEKTIEWPNDTLDLAAPIEQEELVEVRRNLLKAVEMYHLINKNEGLILLVESYSELKELSRSETCAIIPFTYAAYSYGFAALEAGDEAAGTVALKEAYEWYPWGRKAEKAREFLHEAGFDLQDPPPPDMK